MRPILSIVDLTSFGARAFLKLGRDDDAYELSRIAVSPEQQTEKKTTLVVCFCILGQVAAKRGNFDESELHFTNALKEAQLSRLPMMGVLAAREWKRHLLGPNKKDCSAAEMVIDAACEKMKKTREQIAPVLAASWCSASAEEEKKSASPSPSAATYEQTMMA